jgi:hypothetical protein
MFCKMLTSQHNLTLFSFFLPVSSEEAAETEDNLTYRMDDGRTGIDGNAFTNGLTAYRQTRAEGGHEQRNDLRPGTIKITDYLHRNGGRGGAGHDTADVAHHIVADGADPFGVPQKADGSSGTGNLPGSHGVERLFIGSGYSHADNVKDNTDEDNGKENEKCHRCGAVLHENVGKERNCTGNQNGHQKNGDNPLDLLFSFPFGSFRIRFSHFYHYLGFKVILGDGSRQDKSYGLGRVVFHRREPAVAAQAVSV